MIARLVALAIFLFAALPASALELVMVEEDGCFYCARWKKDVGGVYPKTPEAGVAPLRMVDIRDVMDEDLTLERTVFYTPTFLLVDEGREIARIEGYPGETLFWWALQTMLKENTNYEVPSE